MQNIFCCKKFTIWIYVADKTCWCKKVCPRIVMHCCDSDEGLSPQLELHPKSGWGQQLRRSFVAAKCVSRYDGQ